MGFYNDSLKLLLIINKNLTLLSIARATARIIIEISFWFNFFISAGRERSSQSESK